MVLRAQETGCPNRGRQN